MPSLMNLDTSRLLHSQEKSETLCPPSRWVRGHRQPGSAGKKPLGVMTFSIYDISGEDVQIIKQISKSLSGTGSDIDLVEDLPSNLRTILDCHVLVFLIDGSKITTEVRSKRYQDMLDYDTVMATLISLVGTYKS